MEIAAICFLAVIAIAAIIGTYVVVKNGREARNNVDDDQYINVGGGTLTSDSRDADIDYEEVI